MLPQRFYSQFTTWDSSEPSLANEWPHNTVHKRWQGTVKSICRAAMLQSGFPGKVVNWCMAFSSQILSFDRPCPIHPHERNAAGDVLPESRYKERRTCWQEHHDGEKFLGIIVMFGQLC